MEDLARDLIGHWPFENDTLDHSSFRHPTKANGVKFGTFGSGENTGKIAQFNGDGAFLEVADHPALHFGNQEFSVAAWIYTEGNDTDVVGTLVSKFDTVTRKGVELAIVTNMGVVYTAQPNRRHLHFGIDDGRLDPGWQDCGRPGNAALIEALAVSDGLLYAGTFETGEHEMGRLWRYDGEQIWKDLGNPDGCNAISSVVEFKGEIYCATGRVDPIGHGLGPAQNKTPGGKVYRLDANGKWNYCGHPGLEGAVPEGHPGLNRRLETGKAECFAALTVYRGELFGTSIHQRRGVFKYMGGERWEAIGPNVRVISQAIYRGRLYVLENGPKVFRYEGGNEWTDCGGPADTRQIYSSVIHKGQLYVGTWPEGAVYRYAGEQEWKPVGKRGWLGYEREVMAMASYNSKVYAGTLPMANVYRMEDEDFTLVGNLDDTGFFQAMADLGYVCLVDPKTMATRKRLVADLRRIGVRPGMDLMVHSALSKVGPVQGGPDTVIDALLEAVGRRGTVLMPSFNHDYARVYNPLTTPTINGSLPDRFWRRPEAIRSIQGSHAVAAIGSKADWFCKGHLEHGIWADESPIGRLVHHGGYILGLGVNNNSSTAYHIAEISLGCGCLDMFGSRNWLVTQDGEAQEIKGLAWRAGMCPVSPSKLDPALDRAGKQRHGKVGQADSLLVKAHDVWAMRRRQLRHACPTCKIRPHRNREGLYASPINA